MAKRTESTDATTLPVPMNFLFNALKPAKVAKEAGESPATQSERVAARRIVAHLWADVDAGRPCAAGGYSVKLSDGSTMPFRLWAEGVLAIREGGKAHAVGLAG